MSLVLDIHNESPQARLIAQAVAIVRHGGLIIYPTDSCYALGCHIGDKGALDRISRIRQVDREHDFTLVCRDLSEIALYAQVDNPSYRLLRNLTPGPYTFILKATREVPRRLQNPKRKTIGVRIPQHNIVAALLESLGEPIMSSTLHLPKDDLPVTDVAAITPSLAKQVDLIIDGGHCGVEPTTVLDLTTEHPTVVRQGKGETAFLTE